MDKRKINLLTIIFLSLSIIIAIALILFSANQKSVPMSMEYETELFNGEIFSVDIIADDETWQHIIDTALDEQYTPVDVVVNGTLFKHVGIRPKGNSSLRFVAMDPATNRFSFKIKFDEYIEGQTCFGLDVLVLNNIYEDDSYMREYISYDMMNYVNADAPLYGYADVTLNNEPWGLYLGLENYNTSFQKRTYGDSNGYLYSAKFADIVGGHMSNMNSNGLDLKYIDNNIDSYASFFSNEVGSNADREDKMRVIKAIEVLNNYESLEELEKYWDMEQIIPYLAAHTVTVNGDSFSTFMCQNYFLYEQNGKVSLLPWDYSSTFGILLMANNASDIINFPIDTPVYGIDIAERPILDVVLSNEIYADKYHKYLGELSIYLDNIENKFTELDLLINEYVKNDSTAFCSYEEFEIARDELEKALILRGESIKGQLNGSIPSTTEEQKLYPEKLINSDNININILAPMPGPPKGMKPIGENGQISTMPPRGGNGQMSTMRPMNEDGQMPTMRPMNEDDQMSKMPPRDKDGKMSTMPPMDGNGQMPMMPPMGENGQMPDMEEQGIDMSDMMNMMMPSDSNEDAPSSIISTSIEIIKMIVLIAITILATIFIKKSRKLK
ncbi:hypothetical protein AN642_00020 [Epulopiscium sp. SCG-B10WGA-EpuloA2]|nr:hypothetical protein AN642_00020 [Epulopiscium sp. SCG-B10WGA-EpuloA2]